MTTAQAELLTPGKMLERLAIQKPDELALIVERSDGAAEVLTRRELDRWSNRLAHYMLKGAPQLGPGSFVVIHFPNSVEHVVATMAAYKLGACPMPVSHRMPAIERDQLLALARPAVILSDAAELAGISRERMRSLEGCSEEPPPDAVPQPFKAIASGGSTGKPKLIVSASAFAYPALAHPFAGLLSLSVGDMIYSPGPLYHNQAFLFSQVTLFMGGCALLNEKFEAQRALDIIERRKPAILNTVPTMLSRMLRCPDIKARDFSSVKALWHLAAPCPDWVKRGWIELLGPARVMELWAATELNGATTISGVEWLKHPGSVGRAWNTEIRILDQQRKPLPLGEVGEIFSRFGGAAAQFRYIGATTLEDVGENFTSVGDLGYLDADGYLYLADRRVDLIICGGANVIPAEVEAVLTQLPAIRDAAVIGLKDEDLGRRVHAILEPADITAPPLPAELDAYMRKHLASYKIPRSYELVEALPRDEAGKIRRGKLREERGG